MTRRTSGTRAGRLRGWLPGVVCAVALVLTGCSGDDAGNAGDADGDSSSSPTTSASPTPEPPRKPRKGDCHRLSWDDALAPTADTEPDGCTNATAITFYVGTLKKRSDGTLHPVDSDVVANQLSKACPRELRSFLGGSREDRRLTVLTTVWFTPTLEEQAAGADWYRCYLVAPAGRDKLLKVRKGMRNALAEGRAEKYELCATGKAGKPSFRHVPCSRSHTWKAVSTVDLAGEKYPGRKEVADRMADPCTDAATDRAADPLNVRWTQEGPTKEQWKAGQRYGVCWVPTV